MNGYRQYSESNREVADQDSGSYMEGYSPEKETIDATCVEPTREPQIGGAREEVGAARTTNEDTIEEKPGRAIKLAETLYSSTYTNIFPFTATIVDSANDLLERGVFDELDFVPTDQEVEEARHVVNKRWIREQDKSGPKSRPVLKPLPHPETDTPPEDAGVWFTASELVGVVMKKNGYLFEIGFTALSDAIGANKNMFFLPTPEEIAEGMRMIGLDPDSVPSGSGAKGALRMHTPMNAASEVEKAVRRAQRAPRPHWPGNWGALNLVQHWLKQQGHERSDREKRYDRSIGLWQVAAQLQDRGYLDTEPSNEELREALEKLALELREAEARHKERKKRGKFSS